MADKDFSFSDALGYGWQTMKANLGFFIGLGFLYFILTNITNITEGIFKAMPLTRPAVIILEVGCAILSWVISIIVSIGMIKIALSFCDGYKPDMMTLFDASGCFWRFVAVGILYSLIVLLGFILLIIPGIIWSIKYQFCFYFVVDKGLRPIDALRASGYTTGGVKWKLFIFGILCILINIIGVMCLIVGIFATYPTVLVALAFVYRELAAQTPELSSFGLSVPSYPADTTTTDEQLSDDGGQTESGFDWDR